MLRTALWIIACAFPISEIALAIFKRADLRSARSEDHGSMRLVWFAIVLGLAGAIACQSVASARVRLPSIWTGLLALACLLSGLAIRWAAIVTLGRQFTVDVAIRPDHALVQHGLYRLVRHPSYSGLLLAMFGVGLLYTNWLSLVSLMVPITLAVADRIAKEERALRAALGAPYAAYCGRTKRLVPGLV
jgi:protein-S-isoprenylcysteine O-methyltransferase Ste14